jgi:hypothetical protein
VYKIKKENEYNMGNNKEYDKYLRPIDEKEMKQWRPAPKSYTTRLFEAFLESEHLMVEVNIDELPTPKPRVSSEVKSTKQDSFASAFYAWKTKRKDYLDYMGIDILLIRRGEKVALKKVRRK